MKSTVIPETWLRCMSREDRLRAGQMTAEEAICAFTAKSEKQLQRQIVSLLRLKGIEVNVSRMDKRKTDVVGWPDLTFSVKSDWVAHVLDRAVALSGVIACAWEVKLPGRLLSDEQGMMALRLIEPPNGWRFRVIHSVDEARQELKEMGIE